MWFAYDLVFVGNNKIIGRLLDPELSPTSYVRVTSLDGGKTWSMSSEYQLPLLADNNAYYGSSNWNISCYAGDNEVYTIRPVTRDSVTGECYLSQVYKSTDGGGVTWETLGVVNANNVKGITYIGKSSAGKKRFLALGHTNYLDGSRGDYLVGCPTVFRSINNGDSWGAMQRLTSDDVLFGGAGFADRSLFAYLGGDEVLLLTNVNGATPANREFDPTIFRSTNAGATWTVLATLPTSPRLATLIGQPYASTPLPQTLLYLGEYGGKKYIWAAVHDSIINAYGIGVDGWLSTDGGQTWTYSSNYPIEETYVPDADLGGGFIRSYYNQTWYPSEWAFAADNGAIPGLYN